MPLVVRIAAWCTVSAMATALVASCSIAAPAGSTGDAGCFGQSMAAPDGPPAPAGASAPGDPSGAAGTAAPGGPSGPAGTAAPVDEALWTVDDAGTLRAVDARTDRVSASLELGPPAHQGEVPALLRGGAILWAYRYSQGMVIAVDPVHARILRRIPVPAASPYADDQLLYAHGALWIAQPGRLWRVGGTGTVASVPLPPGGPVGSLTATPRWLWLTDGSNLVRVDPGRLSVNTVPGLPGEPAVYQLLGSPVGLFAIVANQPTVWALDPDRGTVRSTLPVPHGELAMALLAAGTSVWATGNCGDMLRVADTGGVALREVAVSDTSQDLPAAAALDSLWVGDEVHSELVRVDVRTGRVLARMPVAAADPDDPAFWVVAGERSVWVVDGNLAGGVSRVDPEHNRVRRLTPASGPSAPVSAVVAAPPN